MRRSKTSSIETLVQRYGFNILQTASNKVMNGKWIQMRPLSCSPIHSKVCRANMPINSYLNADLKPQKALQSARLFFVYRTFRLKSHFFSQAIKLSNMTTIWNKVSPWLHSFSPPSNILYSKLKHQTGTCWLSHLQELIRANDQQGMLLFAGKNC